MTAAPPSILVPVFLISLSIPLVYHLGPFRLSPYRLLLLILFVPLFVAWLSGRMGNKLTPDWLILGYALWSGTVLMMHHGVIAGGETAGLLLIETCGAYLLGRRYVRSPETFNAMVRCLFLLVLIFLPLATIESLSHRPILIDVARGLFGGAFEVLPAVNAGERLGLRRAQVGFDHPILYGTVCAMAIGVAFYVLGYGKAIFAKLAAAGLMVGAAGFSVSSGPLAAIATQLILMVWDGVSRSIAYRWRIFAATALAFYLVIDLLSTRTPFHVIVTYLTFNSSSSYNRILIWRYGSAEVWRHPVFGIGLGDWERPSFMSSSMDNFWLVIAVQHGLPGFFMFAGAVVLIIKGLSQLNIRDPKIQAQRAGILVSLGGLIVAGCTVHYWNAVYCSFMFLLGSAVWMIEQEPAKNTLPAPTRDLQPRRTRGK